MMKKIHYKSAQEISTVEPATSRCQNCPKMAPPKKKKHFLYLQFVSRQLP